MVVGAGVVGLAVARELQLAGYDTLVIERHAQFGTETSSRNSEVIHAGIYYPPGSLKARLSVRGKALLYDYCRRRGVPFQRIGKLIVATQPDQMQTLTAYQSRAAANGVEDLRLLDRAELQAMEPSVSAMAALHSPSSGIVDSHALMAALAADFDNAGGTLVCRSEVVALQASADGVVVTLADGYRLLAERLINSAGLRALQLAHWLGVDGFGSAPPYCKGHYYHYTGPTPFRHLVYPVAVAGGLGIHVTLDLAGQVRFGPDVRWVDTPDYHFDDSRRHHFVEAIRRYFPDVDETRLTPGYTGIRPKIVAPGSPDGDFVVRRSAEAVHLLGIESPGLTAALALAEQVRLLLH